MRFFMAMARTRSPGFEMLVDAWITKEPELFVKMKREDARRVIGGLMLLPIEGPPGTALEFSAENIEKAKKAWEEAEALGPLPDGTPFGLSFPEGMTPEEKDKFRRYIILGKDA